MTKELFTVFTPTFNRAAYIDRAYTSLKNQTLKNFEWIIIDDGSTDNTQNVIKPFLKETEFRVKYFYQENRHKKVAYNFAVKEASGELLLTLDSDDEFLPNAIEIFTSYWQAIPTDVRKDMSAITAHCVNIEGEIVGTKFPKDQLVSDSNEIRFKYKVKGEKCGFQRVSVLKEFPFPENVQGYVPESVVWSLIAGKYKTLYINEVVRIYHSGNDQITVSSVKKRCDGGALWTYVALKLSKKWFIFAPLYFIKIAINYSRYHFHLSQTIPGKKYQNTDSFTRILVAILKPVAFLLFILDNTILSKSSKQK